MFYHEFSLSLSLSLSLFGIFLMASLHTFAQDNYFYYTFDYEKVYLDKVANSYVVEFPAGIPQNILAPQVDKINDRLIIVSDTTMLSGFSNYSIRPLYLFEGTTEKYILTGELLLKFKENILSVSKNNLIQQLGLTLEKTTTVYEMYSVNNILTASQSIYESGLVEFCYPNSVANIRKAYFPNDPFFNKQFYLHNTGQVINDGEYGFPDADIDAPEAWNITKGSSNIVVAVIDNGVVSNHPDLPNSRQVRLNGSNFGSGNPDDPSPTPNSFYPYDEKHGMACAGIVAATQDNNEGATGVAPLCKIMPIKLSFNGASSDADIIDAIKFADTNGADVISCSWYSVNISPGLVIAIQDAINNGSVVLFGAGNNADHANNDSGYVRFPADANIDGLITVGASDKNDQQSNYSPTDTELDIVAPSNEYLPDGEVWTTDIPGDYGYNPQPSLLGPVYLPSSGTNYKAYTGNFGGTSASTPVVAGIATLMLSVNPCLTPTQVRSILIQTADEVGGYNYNWNPDMPGHSKEMGHGRANAYDAVSTAQQMHVADADLYMKDQPEDFGIEPNPTGLLPWKSQDIWVRHIPDDIEEHQNPEYLPGDDEYVYVKVRNKGCQAFSVNAELKVYWTKSSTGLSWDNNWKNYHCDSSQPLLVCGDIIGSQAINATGAGEYTIYVFPWQPPNPSDFASFGGDKTDFCLLARIETDPNPPYGMSFPETMDLRDNVEKNNNIVWKNVTVVDLNGPKKGYVTVRNIRDYSTDIALEFKTSSKCPGNVFVDVGNAIYNKWIAGGSQGINIVHTAGTTFEIENGNGGMLNLRFDPQEQHTVEFHFGGIVFEEGACIEYIFDLLQYDDQGLVGGETFVVKAVVGGGEGRPFSPQNNAFRSLKLYPNPAKNHFSVETIQKEPLKLRVYDVLGRLLEERQFTGKTEVSTLGYAEGLYFVSLENLVDPTRKVLTIVVQK